MTPERATDINRRLVLAYMVRDGLTTDPLPDLSDVSLTEAVQASQIVAARGPEPHPERPNVRVYTCHVEPTRVHGLWFWATQRAHEMEVEDV